MSERVIPNLGKMTVIFDGTGSLEFDDVPEDFFLGLAKKYAGRRPFYITHGGRRLLQFPKRPPQGGIHWARNASADG